MEEAEEPINHLRTVEDNYFGIHLEAVAQGVVQLVVLNNHK